MADKILRYLAIANFVDSCIVVLLQLAMLITLHNWVDWICIGFWGGALMMLTGMWTLQKRLKKMIKVAVLTIVSGLCMVGFYSWNVSIVNCGDIQEPTPSPQDMSSRANWEEDANLCAWRQASDILFIIFGCLTIVINMFLAARASTLVGDSH